MLYHDIEPEASKAMHEDASKSITVRKEGLNGQKTSGKFEKCAA